MIGIKKQVPSPWCDDEEKKKEAAIYKDHFTLYDFEKLLKKNEKGINKSLEN